MAVPLSSMSISSEIVSGRHPSISQFRPRDEILEIDVEDRPPRRSESVPWSMFFTLVWYRGVLSSELPKLIKTHPLPAGDAGWRRLTAIQRAILQRGQRRSFSEAFHRWLSFSPTKPVECVFAILCVLLPLPRWGFCSHSSHWLLVSTAFSAFKIQCPIRSVWPSIWISMDAWRCPFPHHQGTYLQSMFQLNVAEQFLWHWMMFPSPFSTKERHLEQNYPREVFYQLILPAIVGTGDILFQKRVHHTCSCGERQKISFQDQFIALMALLFLRLSGIRNWATKKWYPKCFKPIMTYLQIVYSVEEKPFVNASMAMPPPPVYHKSTHQYHPVNKRGIFRLQFIVSPLKPQRHLWDPSALSLWMPIMSSICSGVVAACPLIQPPCVWYVCWFFTCRVFRDARHVRCLCTRKSDRCTRVRLSCSYVDLSIH